VADKILAFLGSLKELLLISQLTVLSMTMLEPHLQARKKGVGVKRKRNGEGERKKKKNNSNGHFFGEKKAR